VLIKQVWSLQEPEKDRDHQDLMGAMAVKTSLISTGLSLTKQAKREAGYMSKTVFHAAVMF